METASAKLLNIFLELKYRTRVDTSWSHSASISLLQQQFTALAKQLDLKVENLAPIDAVKSFENASFLKARPLENYAAILLNLEEYEPMLEDYTFWKKEVYKRRQLSNLFGGLLSFKLATDFRYFGALEGLEVGGSYAHSLKLKSIDKDVKAKIDHLLTTLIDPEQIVFNFVELREEFGYPSGDYDSQYLQERIDAELES